MILGLLVVVLLCAAWSDFRSNRIPNALVFSGAGMAVLLNAVLPGGLGIQSSLTGLGLGLALMLPIYVLKAIGAGDVKLMAMIGAFLGPADVLGALLFSFLVGGMLALVVALRKRVLRKVLTNIKLILFMGAAKISMGSLPTMEDAPESAGKLPFGVAIATGTLAYVAASRLGWHV